MPLQIRVHIQSPRIWPSPPFAFPSIFSHEMSVPSRSLAAVHQAFHFKILYPRMMKRQDLNGPLALL